MSPTEESHFPCPKCSANRAGLEDACANCGWYPSSTPASDNPYVSPHSEAEIAAIDPRKPVSLVLLTVALLLTLLCALINTIQEEYPLFEAGGLILVLIAGISQVPGLLISFWRWKTGSIIALVFVCAAWIVALTGLAAYAGYALDTEKADSINSAAHMYVIAFPVLHCIFAVVIYGACGIAAFALILTRTIRPATSNA